MRNFRYPALLIESLLKGKVLLIILLRLCRNSSIFTNSLFCFFVINLIILSPHTIKADYTKSEWMNSSLDGLKTLFASCIEVPEINNFNQGSIALDIGKPSTWSSTGTQVQQGKAIKFDWSTRGMVASPRKYRVIYRIDPRFAKPQIFIKSFNYLTNKYEADNFPKFNTTDPTKDYTSLAFGKMSEYVDYFNFAGNRQKIRVEKGDVVNITLAGAGDFFGVDTEGNLLNAELDNNSLAIPSLYTNSNVNNKILYSTAEKLCDFIDSTRSTVCDGVGIGSKYKVLDNVTLVGKPLSETLIQSIMGNVASCSNNADGKENSPVCFYDQGRGMRISINGQVIKKEAESFVYSKLLKKSFLYYKSDIAGNLDFLTNWAIQGMFTSLSKPLMANWLSFADLQDLSSYINSQTDLSSNFLHFGRYIMIVEIGNGQNTISTSQQKDIDVEYIIVSDEATPSESSAGTGISQDFTTDADKSGYLWVRVKNPNKEVMGIIRVNYANYTGSTWFSDIVYTGAVLPITEEFHKFTMNFYVKLVKNATLQRIAKAALVLYIVIYALTFLAGATQITAKDLIARIIKITIIVILMGEDSWNFFNNYLFKIFTEGTDYIIGNVVGATGSKGNIFGFIDPIFDKYGNKRFWLLLFTQLLQIHNGLTFVAIVTIYSLTIYFRAMLEVIISYVIAFVGLAVMISLAPFFIIMVLFEKTQTIFYNWLSTLFNYAIQPSILLIFFLLIDQVMSEQLLKIVVRACWGTIIPLSIGLDLSHMDMPINFSFTLPFLPGIPFFVPSVSEITDVNDLLNSTGTFLTIFTSTLVFYAYCKMSYGLVDYVTVVAAQLTNVTPAKQEGNIQAPSDPTKSIYEDMVNPARSLKNIALSPFGLMKDKLIDQNYKAKKGESSSEYTGKIFASRNDADDDKKKS